MGATGFFGQMLDEGFYVGIGFYTGGPATNKNNSLWSVSISSPTRLKGEMIVDAGSLLNTEDFDEIDVDSDIKYQMGWTLMLGLEIWNYMDH